MGRNKYNFRVKNLLLIMYLTRYHPSNTTLNTHTPDILLRYYSLLHTLMHVTH
jgi:hypothetical protein